MSSPWTIERGQDLLIVFKEQSAPSMFYPPTPPMPESMTAKERIEIILATKPQWNSHRVEFCEWMETKAGEKNGLRALWKRGSVQVEMRISLEDVLFWGPIKPIEQSKLVTPSMEGLALSSR